MTWKEFVNYAALHHATYFPMDESVRVYDIESWALVIFFKDGRVEISGPPCSKTQPKYTEFSLVARVLHGIAGAWGEYCKTLKEEEEK